MICIHPPIQQSIHPQLCKGMDAGVDQYQSCNGVCRWQHSTHKETGDRGLQRNARLARLVPLETGVETGQLSVSYRRKEGSGSGDAIIVWLRSFVKPNGNLHVTRFY